MSMFHELMMRKKEQIMYATIKGTLTENDGVFSGFSNANYLKLSPIDTSSFQFVFKITTSATFGNFEGIIVEDTATTYKSRVQISPYGKIMLLLSSNGTSWDIADNVASSQFLSNNTDYYIKFVFDGTKYVVSFSVNGQTYETAITVNSTTTLRQLPYIIGYNTSNNTAFGGSIDLNNSYIKIGSTKYKLQAVVGYTVVGSPTIVDCVASGFSSANYLECQSSFTDVTDFEYNTTFTVNNLSLDNVTSISRFSGPYGGLRINTSGFIGLTFLSESYTTIYSDISAQNGEKYNANVKLRNGILSLRVKKDTDTQWNTKTVIVQEVSFGISFYFGRGNSQYNAFGGSIDLNETYIKVNNKLWFNGQQS